MNSITAKELEQRLNPETNLCDCICGKAVKITSIRTHLKSASHNRALQYGFDAQRNVYNCTCGKTIKRGSFTAHLKSKTHSAEGSETKAKEPSKKNSTIKKPKQKELRGIDKLRLAQEMLSKAQRMIDEALCEMKEDDYKFEIEESDIDTEELTEDRRYPRVIDAFTEDSFIDVYTMPNFEKLFLEENFTLEKLYKLGRAEFDDDRVEKIWKRADPVEHDIVRFSSDRFTSAVIVGELLDNGRTLLYPCTEDTMCNIPKCYSMVLLEKGISPIELYLMPSKDMCIAKSVSTFPQDPFFRGKNLPESDLDVFWDDNDRLCGRAFSSENQDPFAIE